jgi:haloalkane dehalogenase
MTDDGVEEISAEFPFEKLRVNVLGSQMAYVDVGGRGPLTAVFLHGNPASSYLWRNVIPHVVETGTRSIAPDLIGMGDSDKVPGLAYRIADHQRYIDAFLDAVLPEGDIVLVVHDWGSDLGFDWARRHNGRVGGLAFMEFVQPTHSWNIFPPAFTKTFQPFRDPETGRRLLIDQNTFVEVVLQAGTARQLTLEEMTHYRAPFLEPESREPTYRFPNEIPIEGKPIEVWEMAERYIAWLLASDVPKLFFWASPGTLIPEAVSSMYIRELKNTRSIALGTAIHFVQEDHPHLIGREIAAWLPRVSGKL